VLARSEKPLRVGRGREFWRELIAEVDGGQRVADVAWRYRVQAKTLTWWRWKLRSEERERRRPLLLPVVVNHQSVRAETPYIELHVGNVILRIGSGTDVAYVAAIVAALRA